MDNRKDMRILIVGKKDILNNIIFENQADFIYCKVFNIKACSPVFENYF